jgi:hypothetical protein
MKHQGLNSSLGSQCNLAKPHKLKIVASAMFAPTVTKYCHTKEIYHTHKILSLSVEPE